TSKTPSYTKSVSWQHHPINNDVYLSDVIFDNNQAYTSTSYSDGDGGAIDVTDNNSDSKHPSGYTIINNTAFTNNTAGNAANLLI
ncbi:hypothetical protein UL72_25725, partial [Shigella dysenteriae]